MKITLEQREANTLGVSVKRTKLPTGVTVHKDRNGNIVRLISPQQNTAHMQYTIKEVFNLPSRINAYRIQHSKN
jgi:hypothetical protein